MLFAEPERKTGLGERTREGVGDRVQWSVLANKRLGSINREESLDQQRKLSASQDGLHSVQLVGSQF
jgi:hypothetical protein